MALMLITHDLGVVAEVAQRVLVMYAGQVVETARCRRVFDAPRHPYTEALLAALPEHNIGRRRLRSMRGVVPGRVRPAERLPAVAALPLRAADAAAPSGRRCSRSARAGALLLSARRRARRARRGHERRVAIASARRRADGRGDGRRRCSKRAGWRSTTRSRSGFLRPKALVRALDGVSFTLARGRTLAVVGESGCGKSTLARQVTMIETPTAGALRSTAPTSRTPTRRRGSALRAQVQMVFQNPYASLNPRKKIGHALEEPLAINTTLEPRPSAPSAAARCWRGSACGPSTIARYPHMFSGGQRQRVAIARALMLQPKVVVADEPVSALDVSIQAQVLNLLMDLQDETGVAYVFISHNLAVVELIADEVLVMYLGKVGRARAEGAPVRRAAPSVHARAARQHAAHRPIAARPRSARSLRGELPSPLAPPSGCVFRTRCPHAIRAAPRWCRCSSRRTPRTRRLASAEASAEMRA